MSPKVFFGGLLFAGILFAGILVAIRIRGGVLNDPFHPQQIQRPAISRPVERVRLRPSRQLETVHSATEPAQPVVAEEKAANKHGLTWEHTIPLQINRSK